MEERAPSPKENPDIANTTVGGTVTLPCLKQYVDTAMQWISAPSSSCVLGESLVSTLEASRAVMAEGMVGSPGVEGSVTRGVEGVVIEGIVVAELE